MQTPTQTVIDKNSRVPGSNPGKSSGVLDHSSRSTAFFSHPKKCHWRKQEK